MKYYDYNANSGNHTVHDTSASVGKEVLAAVRDMLAQEEGEILNTGCRYKYDPELRSLGAYISSGSLVCLSIFFRDEQEALESLVITEALIRRMGGDWPLPDRLVSPGLITTLMDIPPQEMHHLPMLADFAQCCAAVIITAKS